MCVNSQGSISIHWISVARDQEDGTVNDVSRGQRRLHGKWTYTLRLERWADSPFSTKTLALSPIACTVVNKILLLSSSCSNKGRPRTPGTSLSKVTFLCNFQAHRSADRSLLTPVHLPDPRDDLRNKNESDRKRRENTGTSLQESSFLRRKLGFKCHYCPIEWLRTERNQLYFRNSLYSTAS